MVGPKYVWLLSDRASDGSIFPPKSSEKLYRSASNCNASQIIEAKNGLIVYTRIPIRQDNNETISGLVSCINVTSLYTTHLQNMFF
jgi:hypothetical protein